MPNRTKTDGEREREDALKAQTWSISIATTDVLSLQGKFSDRSTSVTEGRRASEREKERAVAHRSIRGRSIRPREGGGRAERGKARRDYPSNFFSQVRHDTQMSAGGEGGGGSGSGFNGAAWSTPLKSMNYETTH